MCVCVCMCMCVCARVCVCVCVSVWSLYLIFARWECCSKERMISHAWLFPMLNSIKSRADNCGNDSRRVVQRALASSSETVVWLSGCRWRHSSFTPGNCKHRTTSDEAFTSKESLAFFTHWKSSQSFPNSQFKSVSLSIESSDIELSSWFSWRSVT